MVVERLEVETAGDINIARVGNRIAQRTAIVEVGTTRPVVGGIVGDTRLLNPVEDGEFVDGQVEGDIRLLLIGQWRTHVLETGPHRVFPRRIFIGIEMFVDGRIRLLHLGICGR